MKRIFKVICLTAGLFLVNSGFSQAALINGDFSSGLAGWTTSGGVTSPAGYAQLSDSSAEGSSLYQGEFLSPGFYTVKFDFKNLLSADTPSNPMALPDTFFASLYFTNNISTFNLSTLTYDGAIGLFDMDSNGVFNNNGNIVNNGEWLHFTMNFNNNYNYVIPVFELVNLNLTINDSNALIDNVEIDPVSTPQPVPEPATIILFGSGVAMVLSSCGKKRIKS